MVWCMHLFRCVINKFPKQILYSWCSCRVGLFGHSFSVLVYVVSDNVYTSCARFADHLQETFIQDFVETFWSTHCFWKFLKKCFPGFICITMSVACSNFQLHCSVLLYRTCIKSVIVFVIYCMFQKYIELVW